MRVEIDLLGRFEVRIDGCPVDSALWRRRHAAALVKLLALEPDRRRHREQVIDALWPDLSVDEAAPRLHKAAHFARRALHLADALELTGEVITLLPGQEVIVDVDRFTTLADTALTSGNTITRPADAAAALAAYGGHLLPTDVYEPWSELPRERLRLLHLEMLRVAGRWEELVTAEPTDEAANLELMLAFAGRGDRGAALGQYERFERALQEELGVTPSAEAIALRDRVASVEPAAVRSRPAGVPAQQTIRFCHAVDGIRIAYASCGEGPPLVKAANWLTHLEYDWESLVWQPWLRGLSQHHELIRYDERGCGLSDWDVDEFSVDAWTRDLETVVDALGLEQFPLLGISQGAAVAIEYAARHPERVERLVLYGGFARGAWLRATTDDDRRAALLLAQLADLGWGSHDPSFRQVFTTRFMPEGTREQWDGFNELQRRTTSPANAGRFIRAFGMIDVTDAARRVEAPTLVVHARDDRGPPLSEGRLLATLIPNSRFVSLDSPNHLLLEREPAWTRFMDEVIRFLGAAPVTRRS